MLAAAALLAGAALATSFSEPATAQNRSRACLQNNRIWSWDVIDSRTLSVRDINGRPFIVHLSGGCVGLTNATLRLGFNSWTSLGCLQRGDRISYRAPALGRMTCFVRGVEPAFGDNADARSFRRDRD
jgi:hypothetical protein